VRWDNALSIATLGIKIAIQSIFEASDPAIFSVLWPLWHPDLLQSSRRHDKNIESSIVALPSQLQSDFFSLLVGQSTDIGLSTSQPSQFNPSGLSNYTFAQTAPVNNVSGKQRTKGTKSQAIPLKPEYNLRVDSSLVTCKRRSSDPDIPGFFCFPSGLNNLHVKEFRIARRSSNLRRSNCEEDGSMHKMSLAEDRGTWTPLLVLVDVLTPLRSVLELIRGRAVSRCSHGVAMRLICLSDYV